MKDFLFHELVKRLSSEDLVEASIGGGLGSPIYKFKVDLNKKICPLVFITAPIEQSEELEISDRVTSETLSFRARVTLSFKEREVSHEIVFTKEQNSFLLKMLPKWVKQMHEREAQISNTKGEAVLSKWLGLNNLEGALSLSEE